MFTMKDLQRVTGFSRDQLRDRLKLLKTIVGTDSQRGPRNCLLVGQTTLAALERMQQLENEKYGPQDAARIILKDFDRSTPTGSPESPQYPPGHLGNLQADILERLIQEKDQQIEQLKNEVGYLRQQVDQLLSFVLLRPRRLWFGWLKSVFAWRRPIRFIKIK